MERFAPLTLRPFVPADEDALIRLITAIYQEYDQAIELETLDDDLRRIPDAYPPPDAAFCVLTDGDRLIGSVGVKQTARGDAELKREYLDAAYRGRGLGRRLAEWACDWARDRGCDVLHIWSDTLYEGAHGLYRALGAEDTGERRSLGGVNDVDEFYFRLRLELPLSERPTA